MADKTNQKHSKTGEIKRIEEEPIVRLESLMPPIEGQPSDTQGSVTGIYKIIPETSDENAKRDTDKPTQPKA
jgi:hypothetical protein